MRKTISAVASFILTGAFAMPASLASGGVLVPGFDLEHAREQLGRISAFGKCSEPYPPYVDMGGLMSRYDPNDPTQSKVDPKRQAMETARSEGLEKFLKEINALADRAVLAKPAIHELDACILHQLAIWARADALLQNVENNDRVGRSQAIMTQAWYGAAFASALAKIGPLESHPGQDADDVKRWFGKLAKSIMQYYAHDDVFTPYSHNHAYWAAYATTMFGVALNNREMFNFGHEILVHGLNSAAKDGSLPREMGRGDHSLMYQLFATLPLAALVVVYDRNGVELTPAEENNFERILAFGAAAGQSPDVVETITKAKQLPAYFGYNYAWIDMTAHYLAARNPALAKSLETIASQPKMRPAWHMYFGGNVTDLYNPEATARKRSGSTVEAH